MNKGLLVTAMTAALGTTFAGSALAVDISGTPPIAGTGPTYANEINILPTGTTLWNVDTSAEDEMTPTTIQGQDLDLRARFGFAITESDSKFIRLDFTGQNAELAADVRVDDAVASGNAATFTIGQGCLAGDDECIIEVAAANSGAQIEAVDTFNIPIDGMVVESAGPVQVQYRLYETAIDATAGNANVLFDQNGTLLDFDTGFDVACTFQPGEQDRIDVVNPTQFIDGVSPSTVATNVDISVNSPIFNQGAGPNPSGTMGASNSGALPLDIERDYFPPGSTVTLSGAMSGLTPSGVALGNTPAAGSASTVTDTATWTTVAGGGAPQVPVALSGFSVLDGASASVLEFSPNGIGNLIPSAYTLSIDQSGGTPTFTLPQNPSVLCGQTLFSGSNDRIDFATSNALGGGTFNSFIRIVNPSNTDGKVTITAYNDDGDEFGPIDIDAIPGISSAVLPKKASTNTISVEDVLNAFPGFALAGTGQGSANKVRLEVRAEFGDNAFDGNSNGTFTFGLGGTVRTQGNELEDRLANGVIIQGFTVSSDGNSFFPID